MRPFIPTWLTAALVALAAPMLLAAQADPQLFPLALIWGGLVLALAGADWAFGHRRLKLRLERRSEAGAPLEGARLSLGVPNRIVVHLDNEGDSRLVLQVKDDPPPSFNTPDRVMAVTLPPFGAAEASYVTTPPARGDFRFQDLHVRARSPLGLAICQRTYRTAQDVHVYPNLLEVRRYDLMARHRRLQEQGFRRMRRGEGTEFESLREYVPDDEFRRIDWKATARRRRPISREYETERSQTIIVMIDAGRMMSAELAGLSKLDHAINAALMLGYVGTLKDDAVGLVAFADAIKAYVPARKGRKHLGLLTDSLYNVQASLCEPDYAAAFSYLRTAARKRALVVLFTDLIDPEASQRLLGHVAALPPRHLPLVVTVSDSALQAQARSVPAEAEEAFEKAIADQLLQARERALAVLRGRGALVLDVPPERLSVGVINEYLELKARGQL